MDVAILAVTQDEYEAVRAVTNLELLQPAPGEEPNIYAWRTGFVVRQHDKSHYQVVLGMCGQHANTNSAIATKATIDKFKPRYVVLCGVAGGFPKDGCKKGDLVISKTILDYQYGNIGSRFSPRHDFTYRCDIGLVNTAQAYKSDWEASNPGIKVLFGSVASGDAIVDEVSDGFFSDVLAAWPHLQAVEMEGAGAAGAIAHAHAQGYGIGFIMVRGISDMPKGHPRDAEEAGGTPASAGTREKQSADRDQWTKPAADAAASFVLSWLTNAWPTAPLALSAIGAKTTDRRTVAMQRASAAIHDARNAVVHAREGIFAGKFHPIATALELVRHSMAVVRGESPYLDPQIQRNCERLFEGLEVVLRQDIVQSPKEGDSSLTRLGEMLGFLHELERSLKA